MTSFKKFAALAALSLTVAVAAAPSAEARGWRHGGGIAAGLLGGALLGAAIAGPAYGYGHGYGYSRPVVYREGGCVRKTVGWTYEGYPIRRTVCY